MIASLRRRHRLMVSVLTLVVPAVAVIAIRARHPWPSAGSATESEKGLSVALPPSPGANPRDISLQFGDLPLASRVVESPGGDRTVILDATDTFAEADLLVYWRSGQDPGDLRPGDDAVLLGPLTPRGGVFDLPPDRGAGTIVLFSLAQRTVRGHASLPAMPWPAVETLDEHSGGDRDQDSAEIRAGGADHESTP